MSGEREDAGSSRLQPTPVAPRRGGEGGMSEAVRKGLLGATDVLGAHIRDNMPPPEGCDDWEYRDLPWVAGLVWNLIMETAGAEHVRAIAFTDRGGLRRGQLWVSPAGCARLKELAQRMVS